MLDLVAVQKDVKKIQEKYVEKGYFLAEVTWQARADLPDNQVAVRYVVNEKAKVHGEGDPVPRQPKRLRPTTLTAVMLTQEGGLLSFLGSAGTYREDMFQRDLAVALRRLHRPGLRQRQDRQARRSRSRRTSATSSSPSRSRRASSTPSARSASPASCSARSRA